MSDLAYYERNGRRYDRVTRIVHLFPNPDLDEWKAKVGKAAAKKESTRTAKIGSLVDEYISGVIVGGKPAIPKKAAPEVVSAIAGFNLWRGVNPIEPVAVQEPVYDDKLGIAGTPDCVCHTEAIDWKVTSAIRWEHIIQVIGYWPMIEATYGVTLERYRIVRFDRMLATWEEKIIPWQPAIHELFVHLVGVYQGWKMLTNPKEV